MGDHDHDHDNKKAAPVTTAINRSAPAVSTAVSKPPALPVTPAPRTVPISSYQPAPIYQTPMPALPKLYVTKAALSEMVKEVLAHPSIETAWGLYGFRYPQSIFVVGVIRPVKGEIIRGYANAEAGGEEMANAMRWLMANEKVINAKIEPGKRNHGEFGFLYKGHSHHTLGFDHYSGTDQKSILEVVEKDGLSVAVGPLALIRANSTDYYHTVPWGSEVTASKNSRVTFLFYMLTREMVAAGYREAIPVRPAIVETVHTLLVPPMGWEFARDDDFKTELRHLKSYGCTVKVNHVDINGKPPLEIQFVIDHPKFKQMLIINTDWNYPDVAPKVQLLPKSGSAMNIQEANRLSALSWWDPGDGFIDIIGKMIEKGCLE